MALGRIEEAGVARGAENDAGDDMATAARVLAGLVRECYPVEESLEQLASAYSGTFVSRRASEAELDALARVQQVIDIPGRGAWAAG